MKVVLFCGGFGMRMRNVDETLPKPMINIGYRPILWHVMKYYSHFGCKDFILCLGWKANSIKQYFLNYEECLSNDFVLSAGGSNVEMLGSDIGDWKITFCDTGMSSSIGERLKAVENHLVGEELFLANYTDGLSDVHLPELLDFHHERGPVATFLSVRPSQSFHTVQADDLGFVRQIEEVGRANIWMNGGYFVFSPKIFDYLRSGEDLVDGALKKLMREDACCTMKHPGFWGCMDTYKEHQLLQDMYDKGEAPWMLWTKDSASGPVNPDTIESDMRRAPR